MSVLRDQNTHSSRTSRNVFMVVTGNDNPICTLSDSWRHDVYVINNKKQRRYAHSHVITKFNIYNFKRKAITSLFIFQFEKKDISELKEAIKFKRNKEVCEFGCHIQLEQERDLPSWGRNVYLWPFVWNFARRWLPSSCSAEERRWRCRKWTFEQQSKPNGHCEISESHWICWE